MGRAPPRRVPLLLRRGFPRWGGRALPEWKLGRKTLFREDPKSHVGAPMLAYMGGGRFCLVECAARPGLTVAEALSGEDGCVLHVTIFEVKYGKRGDLETTALHLARSYLVTRYSTGGFSARAFWMLKLLLVLRCRRVGAQRLAKKHSEEASILITDVFVDWVLLTCMSLELLQNCSRGS